MEILAVVVLVGGGIGAFLWVRGRRDQRLAAQIRAAVDAGSAPPFESLRTLSRGRRLGILSPLIRDLCMDNREADVMDLVVELVPVDRLLAAYHAVAVVQAGHGYHRMAAVVSRAIEGHPRQAPLRTLWAEVLMHRGAFDEAIALIDAAPDWDPDLQTVRARIEDVQTPETEDAIDVLARDAASGALRPHSAVNHLTVGLVARGQAERATRRLAPIDPPERAYKRLLARVEKAPEDALALAELGLAELRTGDAGRALPWFRRALEADPTQFAVHLGLGAALRADEARSWTKAKVLPEVDAPPPWVALFPDWDALTALEQRIVVASVAPLQRWASAMVTAGRRLRVAPLTSREADWTEPDEAVCFVQDLSHLDPEDGWALAYGFALRVFDGLDDADGLRVMGALEQAQADPHTLAHGELDDMAAFFARSYVHWVHGRHFPGGEHARASPALVALWERL